MHSAFFRGTGSVWKYPPHNISSQAPPAFPIYPLERRLQHTQTTYLRSKVHRAQALAVGDKHLRASHSHGYGCKLSWHVYYVDPLSCDRNTEALNKINRTVISFFRDGGAVMDKLFYTEHLTFKNTICPMQQGVPCSSSAFLAQQTGTKPW